MASESIQDGRETLLWPMETIPPLGTEGPHPHQPAAPLPWKNPQCHTGWKRPNRPFCKATWKYYDCIRKAFTHFDRHSQLNKEALSAPYKEVVTPVEQHAPTNELISDMNCGVYVRVFRCSAHSFPSLLWAEFKGETGYCTVLRQTCQRFLTETTLWDYTE